MPDAAERQGTPLMRLDAVDQVFSTKRGPVPAVKGVTLDIDRGQVLCIVGESGCGKTTTARMAAGLTRPTSGQVRYRGHDIWAMSKTDRATFRREVQYIHQDPYASLNPIRSIADTLTAPLRHHKLAKTRSQAWDRACELLARVDLNPPESYLTKFPHQLSGGQRQRVSIARALSLSPKLMIADESTSMLDVSLRVGLLTMLTELRDELDVGFLFITHDLAIAKYFGWTGQTAVMYLGKVVEFGPTPQVINHPRHPYTQALLRAAPEPDPDLAARKLPGGGLRSAEIPSLRALPTGCSFHPRCPRFVEGTCDVTEPQLLDLRPPPRQDPAVERRGPHQVACHVAVAEDERATAKEPA